MNRFLREITEAKRREVAEAKLLRTADQLEERLLELPPCRGFGRALAGGSGGSGTRIIAEVKRRSPSIKAYLQQSPPPALARVYAEAGASALSLVTDAARFGTSLLEIRPMRRVADLPLIAKDFVIDPHQILALRVARADAILLIARLLDDTRLQEFHAYAVELGLDVLVECHDEIDVQRAIDAKATLIGINNRDLDDFTVTLDTSRRLLPTLPAECVRVVESGVQNREQILELERRGASAFLIGGALLQDAAPGRRLMGLLGADRKEKAS